MTSRSHQREKRELKHYRPEPDHIPGAGKMVGADCCVMFDTFSGSLGELPKGRRTVEHAVRVLATDPRVSTFERGTPWLESLLVDLKAQCLIVEDCAEPYPWHRFNLTPAGRQLLITVQPSGRTE